MDASKVLRAYAIKVACGEYGERWFVKFGRKDQTCTAWSLAGATLYSEVPQLLLNLLRGKGKSVCLFTVEVVNAKVDLLDS